MKQQHIEAVSLQQNKCFISKESIDLLGHETASNISQNQNISTRQKLRYQNKKINYKQTKTRTHHIEKEKKALEVPKTKHHNKNKLRKSNKFNNKNKLNLTLETKQIQEQQPPNDGYTFFTNEIDSLYLSSPEKHHFQILNKLLENKQYSLHQIVSQTTSLEQDVDGKIETYIKMLQFSKRQDDQISVLIRQTDQVYQIYFNIQETQQSQLVTKRCLQLDEELVQVMLLRQSFMNKLNLLNRQQSSNTDLSRVNEIFKQILFLGKYLENLQKRNFKQFSELRNSMQEQINKDLPCHDIELDKYIEFLIFKNIKKSVQAQSVLILNYFKEKHQNQQGQFFRPFQTKEQMISFIKVRKSSKNKTSKLHLCTSCICCLGDYKQLSNPFSYCKKCHTRTHRYCKLFYDEDQCNVCKFSSLKSKDTSLKQCSLCPIQGLANCKIGNEYIHVFCCISFGLFRIQDQKVIINQNVNDMINVFQKNKQKCYHCQSVQGGMVQLVDSNQMVHPACSFFKGNKMNYQNNLRIYENSFCNQKTSELAFFRAYRLNLNKTAHKYYSFEQYKSKMSISVMKQQKEEQNSEHLQY